MSGGKANPISAKGKHVVVIGGGDTGSDCVGTSYRHGAASVTQFELMPQPPEQENKALTWPYWPIKLRTSSSHVEGCERVFAISTREYIGEKGKVTAIRTVNVEMKDGKFLEIEGSERTIPAQLVLLAMGFTGPDTTSLVDQLGVELDDRGNVTRDESYMTNVPGVFVAGDAGRGQSLIVWAIAEGRAAAHGVDAWLTGTSALPRPISPRDRPVVV